MHDERDLPFRLSDIGLALAFLTRLPVRPRDHAFRLRGARAVWAWPVAGALVGFLGALAGAVAAVFGASAGVAAAVILAAMALATGALHEDGLADSFDGLAGGRTRAERLEIMRDSRIGSFGALALILVTLARWSALTTLLTAPAAGAGLSPTLGLLAAAAVSRLPMGLALLALATARSDGLAHGMGKPPVENALAALAIALVLALLAAGGTGLLAFLLALLATVPLFAWAKARIGGQTGDVLGASQQIAEAVFLATLAGAATG